LKLNKISEAKYNKDKFADKSYFSKLFYAMSNPKQSAMNKSGQPKGLKLPRNKYSIIAEKFHRSGVSQNAHLAFIYSHVYIPKHIKTLPFYDMMPLYIPFKIQNHRLWVFNLHYLDTQVRKSFIEGYIKHLKMKAKQYYGISYLTSKRNKSEKIFGNDFDIDNIGKQRLRQFGLRYIEDKVFGSDIFKRCIRSYLPPYIISNIYRLNFTPLYNDINAVNMAIPAQFKIGGTSVSSKYVYDYIRSGNMKQFKDKTQSI